MVSAQDILVAIEECGLDYLALLRRCQGFYRCPKDVNGKRLGPLVPYRGEYLPGLHYVGDVYANFAKAEQWPFVVRYYAAHLLDQLADLIDDIDVFCGAPEGGKCLADKLAMLTKRRYVYPEKKGKELVWGRHGVERGEIVVLVEDVSNNFTTSAKMVQLVRQSGANPLLIVTFLNRSTVVDDEYQLPDGLSLPVIALVHQKIEQYRQDDAAVIDDVNKGNVEWKVKDNWASLEAAMERQ